jgi:hypothetical protein
MKTFLVLNDFSWNVIPETVFGYRESSKKYVRSTPKYRLKPSFCAGFPPQAGMTTFSN